MTVANALTDYRDVVRVMPQSRRRCNCGCGQRATHIGRANGVGMIVGCELSVRRWARKPQDAWRVLSRRNTEKR